MIDENTKPSLLVAAFKNMKLQFENKQLDYDLEVKKSAKLEGRIQSSLDYLEVLGENDISNEALNELKNILRGLYDV